MKFTVAAAQYPIDELPNWAAFAEKLGRWVREAADAGAKLAVFPEYGAMELAALQVETKDDLAASMHYVASLGPHVDALHMELARQFDMHILAASMPVLQGEHVYNAARLFTPSGSVGVQEKLVMTRFEREKTQCEGAAALRLFHTSLGRIGVLIGYDAEFPLPARALVEAGADVILIPSCNATLAGFQRVRVGARARALENQCYTIQASTVWDAEWSPAVRVNRGAAGFFGPPDKGFPDSGVIAQGERDRPQWVFAELDIALVDHVRRDGAARHLTHWADQPGSAPLPDVEQLHL